MQVPTVHTPSPTRFLGSDDDHTDIFDVGHVSSATVSNRSVQTQVRIMIIRAGDLGRPVLFNNSNYLLTQCPI